MNTPPPAKRHRIREAYQVAREIFRRYPKTTIGVVGAALGIVGVSYALGNVTAGLVLAAPILGEAGAAGYTEVRSDKYKNAVVMSYEKANEKRKISWLQRLFLANPEEHSIVTANLFYPSGLVRERKFLIHDDVAKKYGWDRFAGKNPADPSEPIAVGNIKTVGQYVVLAEGFFGNLLNKHFGIFLRIKDAPVRELTAKEQRGVKETLDAMAKGEQPKAPSKGFIFRMFGKENTYIPTSG